MTTIDLNKVPYSVDPITKVISVSEKHIHFATTYNVISKTRTAKVFDFSHSTGPEFDPNTKWVYKCENFVLEVCNDKKMTAIAAENYLRSKMKK